MDAAVLLHGVAEEEVEAAIRFMQQQGDELEIAKEKRSGDVRLWADLAQIIMNLKEFIFIE